MLLRKAIDEYLVAARQAGKSDATLYQYEWHLKRMATWLEDTAEATHLQDVTRTDLRSWGAALWDHWSPATIRQAIIAARTFFAWCYEEGLRDDGLARVLKLPKVKHRIQRTLDGGEILALMSQCDTTSAIGRRNLALVALLADSGLRAKEICRLRLCNLDLGNRRLKVIAKGGNEETAYFGHRTGEYLAAWLADRERLAAPEVDAVFISIGGTTPGRPLTTSGLRNILRRLGQQAGVPGVCPHAFRRAFATLMVHNGAPTRVVQKFGRWTNLEMVERYTRGLDVNDLFQRYSPIDQLTCKNTEQRHLI